LFLLYQKKKIEERATWIRKEKKDRKEKAWSVLSSTLHDEIGMK
jgi:hypothetical protein